MTTADFSFPNHEPDFLDEVVAQASEEVVSACGGNERCIFDATQTGNVEVGLETMNTDQINQEEDTVLCKSRITCYVRMYS